ncbi:MAG: PilT/PilU family type 4a pilus ATPase [Sedimentisphaerales bacterium]|nr:PilT/PilU family type 4a pilus ATPase [Sedimentisphaerales bacterium]
MNHADALNVKVYQVSENRQISMRDLLNFFHQHGSLRVSDLHLKVNCPPNYRIDGWLQPMKGPPLDRQTVEALAHSLLSDTEWAHLLEKRSVDSSLLTETMQFRLNCFYDTDGLTVAVRALDPDPIPLEQIGFPNRVWHDIINKQWGLVLITGITGAGKSTTIASLIMRIAEVHACRIITLEDPVEYHLTSKKAIISQREVGRDVPGFARGLRDCLREDPDVIFVGEMRDRESASWTLTAAETGHLVFSTLHTRDARGSISRLLDMFPANQQDEVSNQLSLGLSHIISQKLIPRSDGEGRVVAMEVLTNSYALANLIRLRKLEQVYSFLQTRTKDIPEERMITLERSLAILVQQGKVSPLEAEKWANHPSVFLDEMKRVQQDLTAQHKTK